MKSKGFLVKPEMGVNISMLLAVTATFSMPQTRKQESMYGKSAENYYDYGIKIFWLDEAEPEFSVYDFDNTVII